MYQLCGTKRYVWIKLCAKVDGFSLIFSLMQKVNGGYWRLNCNEKVLLFYIEMWKCSIFYRKNDKTIEFKSLCPCQRIASNCSDYWLFSLLLCTFLAEKVQKMQHPKNFPHFSPLSGAGNRWLIILPDGYKMLASAWHFPAAFSA